MQNWLNKKYKKKIVYHKYPLVIILICFALPLLYIFSKLMVIKPDGLFIGQDNAWGDWVVHISITNIFANKPINEWFLYHPFFAYGKLTYGFLVHLVTAIFMRLGFRIDIAFFIVSLILLLTFLSGIYFFYYQLVKSRRQSILAIFIFLTSSGLGIFRFLNKISWSEFINSNQDFSKFLEYDWYAGNIVEAMIIPQRAFFIGISIGIWALNLLLWGLDIKKINSKLQKKLFLLAGILAGILPIAHMHSFIVIVAVTGVVCFFHKEKLRKLLYFIFPAGLISTILYFIFIHGGIKIDNFMTISIGWTVGKNGDINLINWIKMWLKLWGIFLPAAIFALIYFKNNVYIKKQFPIYLGFIIVFFLANIVTFQPTAWDNTKLFAWVYLGLAILVAKLIFSIWQKSNLQKLAAVALVIILCATGTAELIKVFDVKNNTYLLSTDAEINLGEEIAKKTATDAVFLTSTNHNHLIPLWANRPIFLGYLGWIKNFGFPSETRYSQAQSIFSGSKNANQIIAENKISYIFVSKRENTEFNINYLYLQQFPITIQNNETIIYDTRELWQ